MKKLLSIAGMVLFSTASFGGTVVGTKHDLSTGTTPWVCEFCHTPHHANNNPSIAGAPLWNRAETTQTFQLYGSATMNAAVGQPGGISRLCLSCHDGVNATTVVHGSAISTKHSLVMGYGGEVPDSTSYPDCNKCHSNWALPKGLDKIRTPGTDLRDDHPISILYPTPAQDPGLKVPPDLQKGWGGAAINDVKLYSGYVECGSCHNVHSNDFAPFLRKSNASSALCLTCHAK